MKYIRWTVLNDGVTEKVPEDWIDASEEAGVIDRTLIPIVSGGKGRINRNLPFGVTGEITSKGALLTLDYEGAPIAVIAVCLHSRSAPALWAAAHNAIGKELGARPEAPWCAIAQLAPYEVLPADFDAWSQAIAVALLRREGW